jgi:hypothetical protein
MGQTVLTFLTKEAQLPVLGPERRGAMAYPVGGAAPMPMQAQAAPMPTQAQMPVPNVLSLVALDGPLMGQRFPVTSPIEIGREGSGLALAFDNSASRRHAAIAPGPAGLTVTDLGSTNGTFVNGQAIQTANAGLGSFVRIGATTFRVDPDA